MTHMEDISYSIITKKVTLRYYIKEDSLLLDGEKLPCNIGDSFCEPTVKHPSTLVWFPETQCVVFEMATQYAKITKWNERYWMETIPSDRNKDIPSEFTTSNKFLRQETLKPSSKAISKILWKTNRFIPHKISRIVC